MILGNLYRQLGEKPQAALHEGSFESASHLGKLVRLVQARVGRRKPLESQADPKLMDLGMRYNSGFGIGP